MVSFVWLAPDSHLPMYQAASSSYIYFNSIHIVKFRTIEGFIDCIVLLRVLEILSEEKKMSCRKYH